MPVRSRQFALQTGLSLVEALVTISVISILVALSFPVVNSAMNTTNFVQCLSLRGKLGQASLSYVAEHKSDNVNLNDYFPTHMDMVAHLLAPYGIRKMHFQCPAIERRQPELAGDFHFASTGVRYFDLNQIDAARYTIFFEVVAIHGNGIIEVKGDGRAAYVPF